MIDKVTSLAEAVKLVKSGDILSLGGMNLYRRPMAFVRELLKTNVRDLTLLNFTSSYESDLLIGAGRVKTLRTCYCGLESFGLAPMFTAQATRGDLQLIEETEASIAFGLRATLAGVGFMPGQGWIGTDLLKVRPDVKVIDDPYTGQPVVAFPAHEGGRGRHSRAARRSIWQRAPHGQSGDRSGNLAGRQARHRHGRRDRRRTRRADRFDGTEQ